MNTTFKPEQFKPVDANVLIQPGPIKKIRTLQYTAPKAGIDPKGDNPVETEYSYERMPTTMRVGQVLAVSDKIAEDVEYAAGDWVVYNSQRGLSQKLDLLAKKSDDDKCPIIMQRFEILAKINIDE
jgi:hypothetical protein